MIIEFFSKTFKFILKFVQAFGYIGIFIMTFIESTFMPIPSEITLIPAGILIAKKKMHLIPVLILSLSGTILGSCANYFIAHQFGRKVFTDYEKYFFLKSGQLIALELFFDRYGAIATFLGRMLPGVKHFISFPAGLAGMSFKLFITCTFLGSFVWISFLLYTGYMIYTNEQLMRMYIKKFNIIVSLVTILIIGMLCIKNAYCKIKKK